MDVVQLLVRGLEPGEVVFLAVEQRLEPSPLPLRRQPVSEDHLTRVLERVVEEPQPPQDPEEVLPPLEPQVQRRQQGVRQVLELVEQVEQDDPSPAEVPVK